MMDLEQRMARMEEEIHILKNQIQSTLLDIEEQIMNHYYPSLRSKDSEDTPSAAPKGQGRPQAVERPEPAPHTADEDAHIAVKRVNLGDLRESKPQAAAQPTNGTAASHSGMVSTAALLSWAKQTMDAIGPRATAEAIESFAAEGYLDAETAELLLQIVSMAPERQDREPANMASVVSALGALGRIVGSHA
jgi:hypothetical protein